MGDSSSCNDFSQMNSWHKSVNLWGGSAFVFNLDFDTFVICSNVREDRVRHHIGVNDMYPMQLLHCDVVAISCPPVVYDDHKAGAAKCLPTKPHFVECFPEGAQSWPEPSAASTVQIRHPLS